MNDPQSVSGMPSLRRDAEQKLRGESEVSVKTAETMSPEQMQVLIHELRVHQIELELQNEELRRTQAELDESRSRYFDLYDLAPAGYCTLNEQGLIWESNLTLCNLLGVTRSSMAIIPFSRFIVPEDQDTFYHHRKRLMLSGNSESCELRLRHEEGITIWVQVVSNLAPGVDNAILQRIVLTDISAIKAAESELRTREALHLSIFDSLTEHVAVFDEHGVVIAVNEAWRKFSRDNCGTPTSPTPIGINYLQMCKEAGKDVGCENSAKLSKAMRAILDGHQSEFSLEYECHSPDQKRWFHVRVTRMLGPRPGLVVSHLNVTNRKLAELALEESRRELLLVANNVPGPVARIDKDLRYLFANKHYETFFGRSAEQVLGLRVPDVMGADLFQQAEPYILRALAGERVTFEYVYRPTNRKTLHGLANLVPERDADQNVVGYFVVSIDITELKQAEEATKEALSILQKVTSRVPGAVYQYRLHPDGRSSMPYASQGLYSLFGVSPEDVVNDAAKVFAHAYLVDPVEFDASVLESAEKLTPWDHEFRFLVDGKTKWLHGNSIPDREPDGSVLWHGFVTDVTERVAAEAARESLESQLRESQKMEAIGTLAGGIAHDFNNALSVILGNVELAQEVSPADDSLKQCFSEIYRAGIRSRDLVMQILSFCRQQPTTLLPISLNLVVDEAAALLQSTMQSRVTLDVASEKNLPHVLADATQIEQVVINLANNAMQAMTSHSGTIEIRLDSVSVDDPDSAVLSALHELQPLASGRVVRLTVSDNGSGMTPSVRERMFEPFFTTKPRGEGTGLGLAVVHGIVKTHGGEIVVESEPGKGTTFHIFLPAVAEDSETRQTVAESPPAFLPDQPEPAVATRGRILLIDDDKPVLRIAKFLLEHHGFSVSDFSDPHAGLDAVRREPFAFQMVLTDHSMPSVSGFAVVAAVHDLNPNLPVAMMSGFVDDELQQKAAKAGVAALISKPFTSAELVAKVQSFMSRG